MNVETKGQIRLLLTATGIAASIIVFVIATVVFTPEVYKHEINWKWVRFAVVTIAFVVYCLKTYWKARSHLGFWAILLCILALHFLGVGYFFYAGAGLPLLIFGPVVALEWALLALALHYFLGIEPPLRKK